jgi:hypothetical protein
MPQNQGKIEDNLINALGQHHVRDGISGQPEPIPIRITAEKFCDSDSANHAWLDRLHQVLTAFNFGLTRSDAILYEQQVQWHGSCLAFWQPAVPGP